MRILTHVLGSMKWKMHCHCARLPYMKQLPSYRFPCCARKMGRGNAGPDSRNVYLIASVTLPFRFCASLRLPSHFLLCACLRALEFKRKSCSGCGCCCIAASIRRKVLFFISFRLIQPKLKSKKRGLDGIQEPPPLLTQLKVSMSACLYTNNPSPE